MYNKDNETIERRDFYVYQIIRQYNATGIEEVCYVGRGCGYRYSKHLNHLKKRKHINDLLQKWYDSNDSSFAVKIIYKNLTNDEANNLERDQIGTYGRFDLGEGSLANKTNGGEGVMGWVPSEEVLAKMRAPKSEEHCISLSMSGKKRYAGYSKEYKDEIGRRLAGFRIGIPRSPETRIKIAKAMTGKSKSFETRAKTSEKQLGEKNHRYGKTNSAEHRAKLSVANSGKTQSAETVAKRVVSLKITLARKKAIMET